MKDERKFKEVIHATEDAEKDKDKFCRAARIERQPLFLFFFTLFYLCR